MKFAFSSNAFLRTSLVDAIRIVASIGYDGIEIMADVPHAYPLNLTDKDIITLRRELEKNNLEISNINAFMHHADGDTYHPSWIEKDPLLRTKRVDYTLRCIELAGALGALNISTEPGGPLEDMERKEGMGFFLEGLRLVENKARERKVRILIEPEPGLLIENSSQFNELYELLDPEVFGINFDIGHFFCVGENPSELIYSMKDFIHHFHMEDIAASREHHHLMLGEGSVDLPHTVDAIRSVGYNGFVTVELYTYEHKAEEAARQAYAYISEHLRNHH